MPHNWAIAVWLVTYSYPGFSQNKHIFSRFTVLVTVSEDSTGFCLYWVAACTCPTVWNIKSSNDCVRGEGRNGRGIIHEELI